MNNAPSITIQHLNRSFFLNNAKFHGTKVERYYSFAWYKNDSNTLNGTNITREKVPL